MLDAEIDCLVLGCTHYHFLTPILKQLLPEHVKIIDSGKAVARQTKSVLESNILLNTETSVETESFLYEWKEKVIASLLKSESVSLTKTSF